MFPTPRKMMGGNGTYRHGELSAPQAVGVKATCSPPHSWPWEALNSLSVAPTSGKAGWTGQRAGTMLQHWSNHGFQRGAAKETQPRPPVPRFPGSPALAQLVRENSDPSGTDSKGPH